MAHANVRRRMVIPAALLGATATLQGCVVDPVLELFGVTTSEVAIREIAPMPGTVSAWAVAPGSVLGYTPAIDRVTFYGPDVQTPLIYVDDQALAQGLGRGNEYRFFGGGYTWVSPQRSNAGWRDAAGRLAEWPPDPDHDRGPTAVIELEDRSFTAVSPVGRDAVRQIKSYRVFDRGAEIVHTLSNEGAAPATVGVWSNTAAAPDDFIAFRSTRAQLRVPPGRESDFERYVADERDGWILLDLARVPALSAGGFKVYADGTPEIAVWSEGYWLVRTMQAAPNDTLVELGEGPSAVYLDPGLGIFEAEIYGPIETVEPASAITAIERWTIIPSQEPTLEALAR